MLLIGYWTVIPKEVVSDSMLIPFGSTIGIYLLITHMGTVIDVYKRQVLIHGLLPTLWKLPSRNGKRTTVLLI